MFLWERNIAALVVLRNDFVDVIFALEIHLFGVFFAVLTFEVIYHHVDFRGNEIQSFG